MKPEARKSPGVDPTQNKKLTVKMKSQLKVKSPETFWPKTVRKGTLINQMTSTVNKKSTTKPETTVKVKHKNSPYVSENDISGISPIKNCESYECMDLTPKIVISCCSKPQEKTKKVSPRKVPRSKVRSPINLKVKSGGPRDPRYPHKEISRVKLEELETQLRKKTSECLNLSRKNNFLLKTVTEKDQIIRDLEIKFPKMLSELKKGMGEDDSKKKVNKELKETIKRNRQLSGAQKQTEDQLKIKEDKLKQAIKARDIAVDELKMKEKESKDFLNRLLSLEKSFPELVNKLNEKDSDLRRTTEMVANLEQRVKILTDDNFLKIRSIDQISNQLVDLNNNVLAKEAEIIDLKQFILELQSHNIKESAKIKRLEYEKVHLQKLIEHSARPIHSDSILEGVNFDDATEDFLDKVSAVSKDQNVTVNLKLTVKKSRASNIHEQSPTHNLSPRNRLKTLTAENNTINDQFNSVSEEYPEVFENLIDIEEDMSFEENDNIHENVEDSNMSEEAYDVSAGTMARAEELDSKVRDMWTKLSHRDQTFDQFESERCIKFTNSVSKLETDLNESILQHNRFLGQVSVAKKLFH